MHIGVHWKVYELRGDESSSGEHGHAAVFDFRFLEPFDIEVSGEVEWIEFGGTNEADRGGGLDEEGHGFGHFGREGRAGLNNQMKMETQRLQLVQNATTTTLKLSIGVPSHC